MTYTGKTSIEWFAPFDTLHEQHLRGVYSHSEFGDVLDVFLKSKEYHEIKAVAIKLEGKNDHVYSALHLMEKDERLVKGVTEGSKQIKLHPENVENYFHKQEELER